MKPIKISFIIIFINLLIYYVTDLLLANSEVYYQHFSDRLTHEQINDLLAKGHYWAWLKYMVLVLVYFFKFLLITFSLYVGYFFTSLKKKVSFNEIFQVVLLSEMVFFVPAILRILWFLFIQPQYTLQDLQLFFPLAAINLFEANQLEPWLVYPLQVLNVFEIAYWLVLAYGMMQIANTPIIESSKKYTLNLERAFGLVAANYGTGLVVWVAIMVFLTLSYT